MGESPVVEGDQGILDSTETESIDLMKYYNCETDWPICLFDFTIKSKIPNIFVFRVGGQLDKYVIDNYFYSKGNKMSQKG